MVSAKLNLKIDLTSSTYLRNSSIYPKYVPFLSIKKAPLLSICSSCLPLNMAASIESGNLVSVVRSVVKNTPPTFKSSTDEI